MGTITKSGVPLSVAAMEFAQPDELDEYLKLLADGHGGLFVWTLGGPPSAREVAEERFRELRGRFETRLLESLTSGEREATAVDTRQPITAPRVPIRGDLWPLLEVDFKESTAKMDSALLRDIRISVRRPVPSTTAGNEKRLKEWLRERLRQQRATDTKQALLAEAQTALPGTTARSFNRAWDAVAPEPARRPGRKKS